MGDRIERVIIWNLEGQILTDPRFSSASSVSTKELIQAYKDYLAYCEPGKESVVFVSENYGKMAYKTGKPQFRNFTFDQIFIPEGFDKVQSEIPEDQMIEYWNSGRVWEKFAKYLITQK